MHTFFWKLQFLARSIFQFVNDDICVCFCVTKLRNDFCWSPEYVMSVIRMWNVRIINVPSQPLQPFNLESSEFFFGFVCPQCRSANLLESSLIPKQQLPLIVDPGVLRHVTHPKNSTLSPMDVVVVGLINLTWRHKQTWKEVIEGSLNRNFRQYGELKSSSRVIKSVDRRCNSQKVRRKKISPRQMLEKSRNAVFFHRFVCRVSPKVGLLKRRVRR